MRNLLFNSSFLYDVEGGGADTGVADKPLSISETVEKLGEEEPKETIEIGEEGEKEREQEGEEELEPKDELAELEEELTGPKEENLELVTPVRRGEILAKYPNVFKDFPYLEKAYYREQQFTETFPTIQEAKNAAEKAGILDNLEQQVMGGDISQVLQAAKNESSEVFARIADNYLPTLRRIDQQAYYHVLGNVIKDTIITMVREGRNLGEQGQPLQAAANILNQFVFGSQTFTPPRNLAQQQDPQLAAQQQQFQQAQQQQFMSQFETVRDDLQIRADNVLKSTIDQHIDPNGSMSDYIKTHATAEAFNKLESLMAQDNRFHVLLDKLWEAAFRSGFSKDSTDKIKSAYLSRAKTLLPTVIKSARNEALRGTGSRNSEERPSRRGPIPQGRSTSPQSGNSRIKKASDIPKGMSSYDFLMKD